MSDFPGAPPKPRADEDAEIAFNPDMAEDEPLFAAQTRFEAQYMERGGVEGVGEGRDAVGNPAITVYVRDSGVAKLLPKRFEDYPVLIEIVGAIDAY